MKQPTKAIILAAGLGTRFLPQTKAMPKEMLPIIDKPVIQLAVEDAVAAGVTEIIIVTGPTKRAIEDHFDRSDEMERELRDKGKEAMADRLKAIAEMANFVYIRQKGAPKGNALPVWNAQHMIDEDEPFFVLTADDFYHGGATSRAQQLKEAYNASGGKTVVSLMKANPGDADIYGMASLGHEIADGIFDVHELVEKPGEANRPSNYTCLLGYILKPDIFPILADKNLDAKGELTLSTNINLLAKNGSVCGKVIDGTWYDTGEPLKYLQTVISIGLQHEKLGPELRTFLEEKLKHQ